MPTLKERWRNAIAFDLDGTICYPNEQYKDVSRRYGEARANIPLIELMDRLIEDHYIYIHTARRMLTCDGDLDCVEREVGEVTRCWLERYSVPHDELVFGKPFAMHYVDDKAMTPEQLMEEYEH